MRRVTKRPPKRRAPVKTVRVGAGPSSLGDVSGRPGKGTVRDVGPKVNTAVSPSLRAKTREELDEALEWDNRCQVGECVLADSVKPKGPKKKGEKRFKDGTVVVPALHRKATYRVYGNPYGKSFYCCTVHAKEMMKTAPSLQFQHLETGKVEREVNG